MNKKQTFNTEIILDPVTELELEWQCNREKETHRSVDTKKSLLTNIEAFCTNETGYYEVESPKKMFFI